MTELRSQPLFRIEMALDPTLVVGATPFGQRRLVPISGGTFEGTRLRGTVVPRSGADWLLERADGSFQQDVRLFSGERVDPGQYYLRIAPFFETAAASPYAWLNNIIAVGVGERQAASVAYDVFEVL